MSAAAIAHYGGSVVRYDPQAAQQARDAAAQAQQQRQQLRVAQPQASAPVEQTLEGELLNKRQQEAKQQPHMSDDEFLARHREQRARSTEGHHSSTHLALAAYQTVAEIRHPSDVDRIGYVDIYV